MKIIEILKNRKSALIAAIGAVLLYQTPKTVQVFMNLNPTDNYYMGLIEGVAFSLFVEVVMIYFVLNGKRWQTLFSVAGMIVVNFTYHQEAIMAYNAVALFVTVATPFLIWLISEEVNKEDKPVEATLEPKMSVNTPVATPERTPKERALYLIEQGHSIRDVASVVKVPKSTVHNWKKAG